MKTLIASLTGFLVPSMLVAAAAAALPTVFPIDDVHPGLTGYGLTVFAGASIDTFGVTVLGVRRNVSPGADLIIVELSGHDLETSSVAQGMSGSPVYVDGKLLGAVSSGWQGALRPIAGVTPAAELLGVAAKDDRQAANAGSPDMGDVPAAGVFGPGHGVFAAAVLGQSPPPGLAVAPTGDPWPTPAALAARLLPGILPRDTVAGLASLPLGLAVTAPGGRASAPSAISATTLQAGSACAVALVYGDGQIGAIGTTCLRDGDQVVMMGHPFLQLGPVDLPLATAEITTTFPSRIMSFKLGGTGDVVGRVTRDQRAGLAGRLGERAPTVPVDVQVDVAGNARAYHYQVALEPQLTPQLVFWCLYSSLLADGNDASLQTVTYDLQTRWRTADGQDLPPLGAHGVTGGPGGAAAIGTEWMPILRTLMTNRHAKLVPMSVMARLTTTSGVAAARIVTAHAPAVAEPGATIPVVVDLEDWRGGTRREKLTLTLPPGLAPGSYRIGVASANEFFTLDAQRAPGLFADDDLEALFSLLSRPRSTATLVAAVITPQTGYVAGGHELAHLPGSIGRALAASPDDDATPTVASYVVRVHRDLDVMLKGYAILPMDVRPPRQPVPQETRP